MFWRKYATTNEAVRTSVFLLSLRDFLTAVMALEASKVEELMSPRNQALLIAAVDASDSSASMADGMVCAGWDCSAVS